jgi:hypothetical protein
MLFIVTLLATSCVHKTTLMPVSTSFTITEVRPTEIPTHVAPVIQSITPTRTVMAILTASHTPTIAVETHIPTLTPTIKTKTKIATSIISPTATAEATWAIQPEARLKIKCLEIAPATPSNLASNGILVLDSQVDLGNGLISRDTYSLNMATGLQTKITQSIENLIEFAVSPDRHWMAYYQSLSDETGDKDIAKNLVIATADDQQFKVIPWDAEWGFITAWLDNQRLVINMNIGEEANPVEKSSTFLVINPFTGERRILRPDYPDIYDFPPVPSWRGWGETVYDSTLTRVVYLQGGEDGSPSPIHYVLWDIEKKQSRVSLKIIGDLETVPRWSPDGSRFALAPSLFQQDIQKIWPSYEIQIVDRNGQTIQTTHLTDYYPWVYIADLSWSPDGQYIAFWFSTFTEKPDFHTHITQFLAVLDTTNGIVTNYCIPGDYDAQVASSRLIPPPLWSPNGKQLIIKNRYTEDASRVILIDLAQGWAAQIAENMEPVGWMVSP